jgi:hypothetical protein
MSTGGKAWRFQLTRMVPFLFSPQKTKKTKQKKNKTKQNKTKTKKSESEQEFPSALAWAPRGG